MKKIFINFILLVTMIVMLIVLGMPILHAASAVNNFYTFQITTYTSAGHNWDIPVSSATGGFNVKSITISQTAAGGTGTAQDVTIYKNFSSSSAAQAMITYSVPADFGTYTVMPLDKVDNQMTGANIVNMPYFAVRSSTSTSTSTLWCNVEYWK